MSTRLSVVLFRTFCSIYCLAVQFGDACDYDGNMCDVDIGCYEGGLDDCPTTEISYGPGPLYENREDTLFWIKFEKSGRYATNLTYTILRRPDSEGLINSTRVQDCCSLTVNETCQLPRKTTPQDQFFVVIPLKDEKSYCKYELFESPDGTIEFCATADQEYCFDFDEDGRIYKRDVFIPLSTDNYYSESMEHCFFLTSSSHVDTNQTSFGNENYFRQESITYTGTGTDIKAVYGEKEVNCRVKTGSLDVAEVAEQHGGVNVYACVFYRDPSQSLNWTSNPVCVAIQTKVLQPSHGPASTLTVTLSVLFSLLAILLIVLAIVWVYRKHARKLKFEKNIQEIPAGLLGLQKDDGNRNASENQIKEIPDEVTFPAGHMEDVVEEKATEIKVADDAGTKSCNPLHDTDEVSTACDVNESSDIVSDDFGGGQKGGQPRGKNVTSDLGNANMAEAATDGSEKLVLNGGSPGYSPK